MPAPAEKRLQQLLKEHPYLQNDAHGLNSYVTAAQASTTERAVPPAERQKNGVASFRLRKVSTYSVTLRSGSTLSRQRRRVREQCTNRRLNY